MKSVTSGGWPARAAAFRTLEFIFLALSACWIFLHIAVLVGSGLGKFAAHNTPGEMADADRVKRAVNALKKRRTILEGAKGYRGQRSRLYRKAKEQMLHSMQYAYRDRRDRKGDFRQLWITRINAAARANGMTYNRLIQGLQQYKAFFKHYPTGTPAEISAALSGQAEGKVVIFATANAKKNDKGEIVDTWGTPLQFYFSHDAVMIRSAGPNKVWEDSRHPGSDDLYRTDTK